MNEIFNLALVFFLSSYWLIVPIVFLVVMLFLWGKRKSKKSRWVIAAVSLIGVVLMAWYGFGRVAYYDWQVKRLCAIDGGVKVYETVELPSGMFNRWEQLNFYRPVDGENALGAEYLVKNETKFLRPETKQPTIVRHLFQVFRRSDGKLLGESIIYGRGGGDLPGLWHPSSYSCPDLSEPGLLKKLFFNLKNEGDEK